MTSIATILEDDAGAGEYQATHFFVWFSHYVF